MAKRSKVYARGDKEYEKVRIQVLKRDKYKCKKCGSKTNVQVHHIKKWADYPTLRREINNLICLCKKCHSHMWGQEEEWEGLCMLLLNQEKALDVNYLMWKLKQEEEEDD